MLKQMSNVCESSHDYSINFIKLKHFFLYLLSLTQAARFWAMIVHRPSNIIQKFLQPLIYNFHYLCHQQYLNLSAIFSIFVRSW